MTTQDPNQLPRCEAVKADSTDCTLAATHYRRLRSGGLEFYCGPHAEKHGARYRLDGLRAVRLLTALAEIREIAFASAGSIPDHTRLVRIGAVLHRLGDQS